MYEHETAVVDFWKMNSYLEKIMPARPAELAAMEAYAEEHDFPIIGPLAGQLCYLVARLTGATRIFELGSGYGYSTAWFAQAVRENVRDGHKSSAGPVVHHGRLVDERQCRGAMALRVARPAAGSGHPVCLLSIPKFMTLFWLCGPMPLGRMLPRMSPPSAPP